MNIYKEIEKNYFIIFIILFFLYWILVINKDYNGFFFIIIILTMLLIFYIKNYKKNEEKNSNILSFIDEKDKQVSNQYELPENIIFEIYKTPKKIIYIRKNEEVKKILYDLKFLEIYDKSLYEQIFSYFEYFLKIHYNVLIGKYDINLFFPILQDIRTEILNKMKTIYFNTPNISTIIELDENPNIDIFIEKQIAKVQAFTYKYMKILYNKYNKFHLSYQAPFEFDSMKDTMYFMF